MRAPLQEGDLVIDAGFSGLPSLLDDSTGRIITRHGSIARVEWRNGEREHVHVANLVRVKEHYIPDFPESAYDLPKFVPGSRVVLGNGDCGRIIEPVTGPTGFSSFRVEIEKSANPLTVGRRVFATPDGMYRVAGLPPEAVASFYREGKLTARATIGCEIVVDDTDQQIGLQKYSSMPSDFGMIFPYEPPRKVTFHMGTVAFPIDVMFVGPHGRIAAIEENCEPGMEQYWSHGRVSAVIEVNGGWCAERDIVVGDLVRVATTKHAQEHFEPHQNRNDMADFNVNRGDDNAYTDPSFGGTRYDSSGQPDDQLNKGTSIFSSGPGSDAPTDGVDVPKRQPRQQMGVDPTLGPDLDGAGWTQRPG